MARKKVGQHFFSPLSFVAVFWSGIRDKHPGYATLVFSSLADPRHVNAVPDPAFYFDTDRSRRKPLSIHCHHCVRQCSNEYRCNSVMKNSLWIFMKFIQKILCRCLREFKFSLLIFATFKKNFPTVIILSEMEQFRRHFLNQNFILQRSCYLININRGIFWIFLYVLYSTLLHLPPLRLHCVGEC